jgi:hypothetical protein
MTSGFSPRFWRSAAVIVLIEIVAVWAIVALLNR